MVATATTTPTTTTLTKYNTKLQQTNKITWI
jgi:hypothetical protein